MLRGLTTAALLLAAWPAVAQPLCPKGDALHCAANVAAATISQDARQQFVLNTKLAMLESLVAKLRKKAADLDAYLKKCGDKPGCTVPVGKR